MPAPELAVVLTATENVVALMTVTASDELMAGPDNVFPEISTMCPAARLCGTAVVTTQGLAFVAETMAMAAFAGSSV